MIENLKQKEEAVALLLEKCRPIVDTKPISDLIDKLETANAMLSYTIRDGIELNYGSWLEWQGIAREMLNDFSIDPMELDSCSSTLPIAINKGLVSANELYDILRNVLAQYQEATTKEKGGAK